MPLVDMHDMLNHAYRNHYAVGAFSPTGLDFIEAIVAAAERCRSPVILGFDESRFSHDGFDLAVAAAERAAHRAAVPIAIYSDRGRSPESAVRAINLGCNGVKVDAGHDSFPVNVANTRRLVEIAHACGVTVEAGFGQAGEADGGNANRQPGEAGATSVEEARAFVQRTRVDCLAVSLGVQPGRPRGRSKPDIERLKRINEAVRIPLAIQVDGGLNDELAHKLIQHGVAKIDCGTALADAAGERIRSNVRNGSRGGYTDLMQGVNEAIGAEVERCLHCWGSAGRAAEVLVQCRAWQPVEHVILYNVEGADAAQVEAMMARGRETLAKIPGVRRVLSGWAVADKPKFRFCWIVEFTHEKVIASYRDHPEHTDFANGLFRPMAGDRISIDFATTAGNPVMQPADAGPRVRRAAAGSMNDNR